MPQLGIQLQGNIPRANGAETFKRPLYAPPLIAHRVCAAGDEQDGGGGIHAFQVFCPGDEEHTAQVIRRTFDTYHYVVDPHTAVGLSAAEQYIAATGDTTKIVVDSTASPYKFASNVCRALTGNAPEDEFDALDLLSKTTGTEIPAPLASLKTKTVRFDRVIDPADMREETLRVSAE